MNNRAGCCRLLRSLIVLSGVQQMFSDRSELRVLITCTLVERLQKQACMFFVKTLMNIMCILHVDRSAVWNQYLLCRLLRTTSTGGSVNMSHAPKRCSKSPPTFLLLVLALFLHPHFRLSSKLLILRGSEYTKTKCDFTINTLRVASFV